MANRYISAQYHASTLTVDYAGSDGTHLLRTGGTIAWRFNNPGNIRPGGGTRLIRGAIAIGHTQSNASFLIFACYEDGKAAKKSLLREKYNDRTIYTMLAGIPNPAGGMMLGYAPAIDNNDPLSYAQSVASHMGVPITTVLSTLDDAMMEKLLRGMEIREGFDGKLATRRDRIIPTTGIMISNGAQPLPNTPVQVKIGAKTHLKKTNKFGQIPRIAHTKPGETVEILLPTDGGWKKQLTFQMGPVSSAYVLFNDIMRFDATVAPKKGSMPKPPAARKPIRYSVGPQDTLGKLATRFKTTVAQIRKYNPSIKDVNKIYQGQILGIYGPPPALKAPASLVAPSGPVAAPSAAAAAPAGPVSPAPTAAQAPAAAAAPPPAQPAAPASSSANQPIAIVQPAIPKAPWMAYAMDEARRFHGQSETVITNIHNYHTEINFSSTMVADPWCASFVNTCLKRTDTPYLHSPGSQMFCNSALFVRIQTPVYGAIMVMRNYRVSDNHFAGKGHVTLVYGRVASGPSAGAIAGLGGNQNDRVLLSTYKDTGISSHFTHQGIHYYQKFYAFYIPASYLQYAQQEQDVPLASVNCAQINTQLFNIPVSALPNGQTSSL
jgi:uncharacterized protein (TIGR02594 family)